MVMRAAFSAALADLWAAITAIQFYYSFLNLQPAGVAGSGAAAAANTTTSAAQASASAGDEFQLFLTLVAVGVLNAAVLLIHRHLRLAEAAGAAGNCRVPDAVAFLLLAAAGGLLVQGQGVPAAVDDDVVAALGAAAFSALPGAATGTFFLGTMTLIFAARVRGGGGAIAGAGFFGEIQGPLLRVLTKIAVGAAAVLVFLVTVAALCIKY